jgi:hypothetical protein
MAKRREAPAPSIVASSPSLLERIGGNRAAKELCDVAVATLVALATLTPDAQKMFETRLRQIADRSL